MTDDGAAVDPASTAMDTPAVTPLSSPVPADSTLEFESLLDSIKHSRGFDFSGYKRASLRRRLDKRIGEVGCRDYAAYAEYLEVHSGEFALLFNTVLINVTTFFRDAQSWEYLSEEIIPRILAGKAGDDPIRVWSAGCASGQEPYSIAIALAEALGWDAFRARVKIYATDIDEDALAQARSAAYSAQEVQSLSGADLEKYFTREGGFFVFSRDLRRSLIFGRHDLLQDSPISRIDLLLCRNTIMYFNAEMQTGILARFHFAVKDGGFLFLGKAEMLFAYTGLFMPLDLRRRVFAKVTRPGLCDPLLLMAQSGVEAAFQMTTTAQSVLDINGQLAMSNKRTRALFHLSTRDIGRPLQDLEVFYRPVELKSRIEQTLTKRRAVSIKAAPWISGSKTVYLDTLIVPLQENGETLGVSISFTDGTRCWQLSEELRSANEELETTNEELQSTVQELETTNEELQSINEELRSINDESQSVNDEMKSVNDELRIVNLEVNRRSDELNLVNAYMESILASLRGGVIVLDADLKVQTWDTQSSKLWGRRPDEVQNLPFGSLDIGLPVMALMPLIHNCLAGTAANQELTLETRNQRGQLFTCKVIVTPLFGVEKTIRGVILLIEKQSSA